MGRDGPPPSLPTFPVPAFVGLGKGGGLADGVICQVLKWPCPAGVTPPTRTLLELSPGGRESLGLLPFFPLRSGGICARGGTPGRRRGRCQGRPWASTIQVALCGLPCVFTVSGTRIPGGRGVVGLSSWSWEQGPQLACHAHPRFDHNLGMT